MESQGAEPPHSYEDVQKSGYLRKHKSMHRRFFVLRAASERGPARLEYYENEKKFRSKSPVPKKVLSLETCFNINKRADSKNKHMIVLYTRSESFAIAADSEEVQDEWYQAMLDLHGNCKTRTRSGDEVSTLSCLVSASGRFFFLIFFFLLPPWAVCSPHGHALCIFSCFIIIIFPFAGSLISSE